MTKTRSMKRLKTTGSNPIYERKKTARQSKIMLTPIEYLKKSNCNMFGDMISDAQVNSVSVEKFRKNNFDKLTASCFNLNALEFNCIIQDLIHQNILNYDDNQPIIDAMLKTNNKFYKCKPSANDLLTPKVNAHILTILQKNVKPGAKVLDVGLGSGVLSVIFANMVNVRGLNENKRGTVTAIDISKEVVDQSLDNISKDSINNDLLLPENKDYFQIIESNGKYGCPHRSSDQLYDVIHVGALNDKSYAPKYLKSQLKELGIMLIPTKISENKEIIRIYQRINGKIKYTDTDLIGRYTQLI